MSIFRHSGGLCIFPWRSRFQRRGFITCRHIHIEWSIEVVDEVTDNDVLRFSESWILEEGKVQSILLYGCSRQVICTAT